MQNNMSSLGSTLAGLSVSGVSFAYALEPVLKDISLTITPRSFIGFVGANGCGKTTLARIFAGKLTPTSGAVLLDGTPLSSGPRTPTWFIGSDPEMQFVTGTAFDEVAFALQARGDPADAIRRRCTEALAAVGLQDVANIHPFFLSTGEQFRLLVAVALAQRPSYLLLDEVTSMMDGHTRCEILDLLERQRRAYGMSVILFTHRLEDLLRADRVVVLTEGRVAFDGPAETVFVQAGEHPEWRLEAPLAFGLRRGLPPEIAARLGEGWWS